MEKKIICAFDSSDIRYIYSMINLLKDEIALAKLGLEFFMAHGPMGVKEIQKLALPIFLDMKLHDIPNTVAGAVRSLVPLSIAMLTIHASGGKRMMQAAREAAAEEADKLGLTPPHLLAVTILTSLDNKEMQEIGFSDKIDNVLHLTELALSSGVKHIVCSPAEIGRLREAFGRDIILITPGIRPAADSADDQRRIMTPKEAIKLGGDYLVIGRPITKSSSPLSAVQSINQHIGSI